MMGEAGAQKIANQTNLGYVWQYIWVRFRHCLEGASYFLRGLTHEPSHFWGFPSETLKYKKDWQGEKCQEPTSIFFPKRQVLGLFLGSWFSAFLAFLLFCFFAFLLLCFPSFCAFLILCFCAFLLLLFYFFLYFSHVFRCSTSCSSASLLPVFTTSLFFFFSFALFSPVCILNATLKTLGET